MLNKEYFLTNRLPASFADLYSMLMAKHHEADYESFASINPESLPVLLTQTQQFLEAIVALIHQP
ncbi:MAG TPA: hypothetical protein PKD90_04825 [Phnomibacter sp.]|nr:hypothetical protein [Phnomibacter sp.]